MKLSRMRAQWWLAGFFPALLCIVLIALARRLPVLLFHPPFRWVMYGRLEFALFGFASALAFGSLIPRLAGKREKVIVGGGLCFVVFAFSALHFLMPLFLEGTFNNLETTINSDGVCIQSTTFTCGPAAAVTALSKLGLTAHEGEIALHAHCNPITGTDPELLAKVLEKNCCRRGVTVIFRPFRSIRELKKKGLVLAITKHSLFYDHYVAVLQVDGGNVVVGDPLRGKITYTYEEFSELWRYTGIALSRTNG